MPAFSKGDRVEFDHKNETLYGTVSRGGAKPKVILDGGKLEYAVPAGMLRNSSVPLPQGEPHPMDTWSLKGYSEAAAMSEETTAFTATVTEGGVPVLSAKNDGRGGCNSYYPITGGYASVTRFEEAAKQWLVDHGLPAEDAFEAGDMWLTWKASQAPYGLTASAMVADWLKATARSGDPETPSPSMT